MVVVPVSSEIGADGVSTGVTVGEDELPTSRSDGRGIPPSNLCVSWRRERICQKEKQEGERLEDDPQQNASKRHCHTGEMMHPHPPHAVPHRDLSEPLRRSGIKRAASLALPC